MRQPILFPVGSHFIVKSFMDKIQKIKNETKPIEHSPEKTADEQKNTEQSCQSSEEETEQCSEESCDEIFFTLLNMYRRDEEWHIIHPKSE